jgi:hypothetical protein
MEFWASSHEDAATRVGVRVRGGDVEVTVGEEGRAYEVFWAGICGEAPIVVGVAEEVIRRVEVELVYH